MYKSTAQGYTHQAEVVPRNLALCSNLKRHLDVGSRVLEYPMEVFHLHIAKGC